MRLTREAGARALWTPPRGGIERLIQSAGQSDGDGPPAPAARYLLLTSGSAGGRKGVLLNGANIGSSVAGSTDRLGSGPDDVWLCSLPLFHVAGLAILWRAARDGSHVVLMPFDADAVAAALHRVTLASLVPTMLRRVLAADPGPYRGLRAVLIGGGPADEGLLRTARDAGIPALRTYGMTETCSQLATVALDDAQPGPDVGPSHRKCRGADRRRSGSSARRRPNRVDRGTWADGVWRISRR